MTSHPMILTPELYGYYRNICVQESQNLEKLRLETQKLSSAKMLSLPEVGHLLKFLVQLTGAQRVLEIGTYTGYATLALAEVLPEDGQIITCERDSVFLEMAKAFWAEAGYADRIIHKHGSALETLEDLINAEEDPFDFVFIDADKRNYLDYYELSLQLLRPGGLMVLDNVLGCSGVYVAEVKNAITEALHALNVHIAQDSRVNFSVIPIGDGVTLVHKR